MQFKGKRALVVGLGRSGVAAAKVLCELGCQVIANDLKGASQLKEALEALAELDGRNIKFVLGEHPDWLASESEVDFIVVSPGVTMELPLIKSAKDLGIPVMSELEVAYGLCKAPIIAITGTKGKSTTTSLVGKMLKSSGRFSKVVVAGNIGRAFSTEVRALSENDIAVLEVSSFQLEGTINFHPMVSALLNLSADHLDRHRSLEAYIAAKKRIFLNQTQSDYAILNADDAGVSELSNQAKAMTIRFSCQKEVELGCFLRGDFLMARWGCEEFSLCKRSELKLLGRHNLYNVLAASCAALIFGVSKAMVAESALNFSSLEHTFEPVTEINGIKFINDSKATDVAAVRAALEALEAPKPQITLIMGGVDKGNDYKILSQLIAKKVKKLILIGKDNSLIKEAFKSMVEVEEVRGDNGDKVMKEAVKRAYLSSKAGDWILLSPACASFDLFRDVKDRGEAFKRTIKMINFKNRIR